MTWTGPPRMEDMAELSRVGLQEPMETRLRLEGLRREVAEAISHNPRKVGEVLVAVATDHAMQNRQLRHALLLLAQRQDAVEVLTARATQLEDRLVRDQRRRQQPWPINVAE